RSAPRAGGQISFVCRHGYSAERRHGLRVLCQTLPCSGNGTGQRCRSAQRRLCRAHGSRSDSATGHYVLAAVRDAQSGRRRCRNRRRAAAFAQMVLLRRAGSCAGSCRFDRRRQWGYRRLARVFRQYGGGVRTHDLSARRCHSECVLMRHLSVTALLFFAGLFAARVQAMAPCYTEAAAAVAGVSDDGIVQRAESGKKPVVPAHRWLAMTDRERARVDNAVVVSAIDGKSCRRDLIIGDGVRVTTKPFRVPYGFLYELYAKAARNGDRQRIAGYYHHV